HQKMFRTPHGCQISVRSRVSSHRPGWHWHLASARRTRKEPSLLAHDPIQLASNAQTAINSRIPPASGRLARASRQCRFICRRRATTTHPGVFLGGGKPKRDRSPLEDYKKRKWAGLPPNAPRRPERALAPRRCPPAAKLSYPALTCSSSLRGFLVTPDFSSS